jgi:hypothetical protein
MKEMLSGMKSWRHIHIPHILITIYDYHSVLQLLQHWRKSTQAYFAGG